MARRWQYQVKTDTLQTAVDIITQSWVGWYERWQEPSVYLQARRSAEYPEAVYPWSAVVDIVTKFWVGSFTDWVYPTAFLQARRSAEFPQPVLGIPPRVDTELSWLQPFSLPQRSPLRASDFSFTAEHPAPSPFVATGWYNWLTEPVRVPQRTAFFDFTAPPEPLQPIIDIATKFGWAHYPWSEPVRTPPRAADFPFIAFQPTPNPFVATGWYEPWADPNVLAKARVANFPDLALVQVVTAAGFTTFWYEPFVDPVRVPQRTAFFDFTAPDYPLQPVVDIATQFAWAHTPWSEPVRVVPRAPYFEYTTPVIQPTIDIATQYAWAHTPWSEPVIKSAARASDFPFLAFQVAPSPFVATGWYEPWVDPVRIPPRATFFDFTTSPEPLQPIVDIATQFGWAHTPWSEPVRVPPRAADFPAETQSFVTTEVVTVDKWFELLSEPLVKTKPRAADFPFAAFEPAPNPFVATGWYEPWSEPVRVAARTPWFMDTEQLPLQPIIDIIKNFGWAHEPWEYPQADLQPKRAAYYQEQEKIVIQPIIDKIKTFGWAHEPWEYPQKFLQNPGLGAQYQQAVIQVQTGQVISITGNMAAKEPLDVLFAGGQSFNPPVTALVGVHQSLPITPS